MANYLKITCHSCGNNWKVYAHEASLDGKPPRCPFCLRRMRPKTWERLANCLFTVAETNKHLRMDAEEKGFPLFQAEIKTKYVPGEIIEREEM